jgi:molecular chaperone DnaK (HSP70)
VNKAVIAVPAKFNAIQRQATAEAYRLAGLKVIRVIEEPTAAAVAYKLHKKDEIHHILVYDFGGGTLDVSLLFVSQGSVQVYATDGDETLGGSDLDVCLYKNIKDKVSISLSLSLSLCLSVCLSVYLSLFPNLFSSLTNSCLSLLLSTG